MKKVAYKIQVPRALSGEFLFDDFHIGESKVASEVMSWWQKARHADKYALLKMAKDERTEDLGEVFDRFQRQPKKKAKKDEEE